MYQIVGQEENVKRLIKNLRDTYGTFETWHIAEMNLNSWLNCGKPLPYYCNLIHIRQCIYAMIVMLSLELICQSLLLPTAHDKAIAAKKCNQSIQVDNGINYHYHYFGEKM